jgi:RNA polymerase sigma factor (sigma-70 family)
MQQPDDSTLIRLIRSVSQRDQAAFDEFYTRFRKRAATRVRWKPFLQPDDVEDVVQDFFCKFAEQCHNYDENKGPPRVYIYRILDSCCIDYLRKQHPPTYPLLCEPRDPNAEPHSSDSQFVRHATDLSCLSGLSDEDRAILYADACHPDGMVPTKLLAREWNSTEATIRQRRHRARKRLRQLLEANMSPDEVAVLSVFTNRTSDAISDVDLAQKLGLSEDEYRIRLALARKILRKHLE